MDIDPRSIETMSIPYDMNASATGKYDVVDLPTIVD